MTGAVVSSRAAAAAAWDAAAAAASATAVDDDGDGTSDKEEERGARRAVQLPKTLQVWVVGQVESGVGQGSCTVILLTA
jgi:hypothetical protein